MRRVIIPALMIMSLLLTGCGETAKLEKQLEDFRAEISEAENISFLAHVCAEMETTQFECVLRVNRQGDVTTIEVVEPELIAGISAQISGDDSALVYDGMILSLGNAMEKAISPIAAMPQIIDAVTKGHVTAIWTEEEGEKALVAAQTYVSDVSYMKLWFEKDSMTPVNAELVVEGAVVVKCRIDDFTKDQELT